MKRINFWLFAFLSFICFSPQNVQAHAKKPTAMVIPAEIYWVRKGFYTDVEVNGRKQRVPDFKRLFQEDSDMRAVISSINGFMTKQEFPLKDLEQVLKGLADAELEEEVLTDKSDNALRESMLDKIKKTAKADIILDIDFEFKKNGPERMLSLNLKGLDAYTSKQIATCPILGKPSVNASLDVMLLEDNYTRMTEFSADLQRHFNDLLANGRETVLQFRVSEGTTTDLETEFGDQELSEILESWLDELCVQSRYSVSDATESYMKVEQVRIPLYDEKNKALDTREFLQKFRKRLKQAPYNLNCRVNGRGLGEAWLVIGSE